MNAFSSLTTDPLQHTRGRSEVAGECAQDDREKAWRIQAVSIGPGSFQNRLSLPAPWQGLRDAELSKLSGIPGCIFVHASGFIGGNKTLEGALEMARQGLKAGEESEPKRVKV